MGYDSITFFSDTLLILILVVMGVLLCSAARLRGESSYAAMLIMGTVVPDYIYNICDIFGWSHVALLMAPVAYSVNLTILPLMLFLAHRAFNPYYVFRWKALLHFMPAILFALLIVINISLMPSETKAAFTVKRVPGMPTILTSINFLAMSVQLVVYLYLIFSYLHKVKNYILNIRTESYLVTKLWVPRFITLVGVMIVLSMLCTFVNPFDGFRLFYLSNVLAMGFLLYSELKIVFAFRNNMQPTVEAVHEAETDFIVVVEQQSGQEAGNSKEDYMEQLQQYARQLEDYLSTSEVYVNPNLSLKDVATATGISSRNLSRAINTVLEKNFFYLVNSYRVDKLKSLLIEKKEKGLTLETMAEQCGFNSRFTLNAVFKKITGLTTSEWLKLNKDKK